MHERSSYLVQAPQQRAFPGHSGDVLVQQSEGAPATRTLFKHDDQYMQQTVVLLKFFSNILFQILVRCTHLNEGLAQGHSGAIVVQVAHDLASDIGAQLGGVEDVGQQNRLAVQHLIT